MRQVEKEQIVQLIDRWRERSGLSIKQVLARVQAHGCDISRAMFENRFIRYDQQPDVAPELTLAVIAAFTTGLTPYERALPAEAIELANLTHLPLDQFAEIRHYFATEEFNLAFHHYAPTGLTMAQLTAKPSQKAPEPSPLLPLPIHFPSKTYQRLIGRDHELNLLLAALREANHKPVVAIVGLGGIGKTALAQEAMLRCWQEGLFAHIVWASAKTERFIGEGARKTEVSDYDLSQLLDAIGHQCDRLDIAQLAPDEKRWAVKQILMTKPVLVVMDNLETILDGDAFVDDVVQLLGQNKLLITSRHKLLHERVFTLDLGSLARQEGLAFLREESEARGIALIAQASSQDLLAIYQVTGGAPLAMKLVVGQASRQSLSQVLHNLQAAKFSGPNYDFYHFIFKHSWDLLEVTAQKVLVSMSVFDLVNGSNATALSRVSQVEPDAVQQAVDQLILLSLVEVLGDLAARRYTLHSLTHYFVLSDIVKKWS